MLHCNLQQFTTLDINNTIPGKYNVMKDIEDNWASARDYILSTVFYKPTSIDPVSKKLVADVSNIEGQIRFARNAFPYQVEGGYHYVLWVGSSLSSGAAPSEDEINNHITQALQKETNCDDFDFGWYVNPRMTIPSVYHVQVFWCLL